MPKRDLTGTFPVLQTVVFKTVGCWNRRRAAPKPLKTERDFRWFSQGLEMSLVDITWNDSPVKLIVWSCLCVFSVYESLNWMYLSDSKWGFLFLLVLIWSLFCWTGDVSLGLTGTIQHLRPSAVHWGSKGRELKLQSSGDQYQVTPCKLPEIKT